MSDEKEYTREKKKMTLRRRVVPEQTEEEVSEISHEIRRYYIRRLAVAAAATLAVIVTIMVGNTISNNKEYTSLEVQWETGGAGGDTVFYESFGSYLIRYSQNGMTCLDKEGTVLWDYGYSMRNPAICIREDYAVIGDLQGQTAVIFQEDGVLGTVGTTMSILNLTISAHGVVALMLDDVDSCLIQFYEKSGLKLDIMIKNVLAETAGYPMDLSLSPKGTGLVLSLVYMDQGSMQSRITFLNFDVGKTESDRVVGVFKYGEVLFPQVEYLTDEIACAFGDNQINLYSLKKETSPELLKSIICTSEIQSVFTGKNRIGVVLNGENGEYQAQVYDLSGELLMEKEIPFTYTHAEFSGDYLLFYNSSECMVLNQNGKVKYHGSLEGYTLKIVFLSKSTFLQLGSQSTKGMKMK